MKIPTTLTLLIVEFIIVMIKVVKIAEGDICLKITAIITLKIVDQELMLTGEVNIGLIPATLPPITQVAMVDCWVYRFLLVLLMKILMKIRGYNTVVMVMRGVT